MEKIFEALHFDLADYDITWRGHLSFSPERSLLCPMQIPSMKCVVFESMAEYSIYFFMCSLGIVTAIHWCAINFRRTHVKNEDMTQKHGGGSVFKMLLTTLCFFPVFLPGILQFQQYNWAKPWGADCTLQVIGTAIVYACTLSFIYVHVSMAEAWSPVPEALEDHKLVTSGSFRFAR